MSLLREPCGNLQQQRRLADAGLAADQHHRARHDTAAEYEVELVDAGVPAWRVGCAEIAEPHRADGVSIPGERWTRSARATGGRGGARGDDLLHERIPLATRVALPRPLRMLGAARGAALGRARLALHACAAGAPR